MNRKIAFPTLFLLLLLLLVFGLQSRNRAAVLNDGIQDPYIENILQSRDFSCLIVSIVADPDTLYDEENGLLSSQYMLQGMDGERQIQICVYEKDGTPLITQNAGIRISGAASRNAIRKSYRIIARKEYDPNHSKFTYDLWNGRQTLDGTSQEIAGYSSFVLHSTRLAGDSTGIHNSVGYALARDAGIADASPTTPAALYINGTYQGAYFIMPAKTDNALAELYNIPDKDDIEIVSVFEEERIGTQSHPEVLEEYLEFVRFVQTSDVNDPEVISEIERQMDVDQCLQYYAVNLLLANGDWLDNNLRVWRCKDRGLPYQDGRWRFFLFDLDWIGSYSELTEASFWEAVQNPDHYNLLPSLLQNPEYLARFKEIIAQMEQDSFHSENIERIFKEEEERMRDEMAYDFQSDAFETYLLYSVNSSPIEEDEWLTFSDWELMMTDFKSHMLKAPAIINECLDTYIP